MDFTVLVDLMHSVVPLEYLDSLDSEEKLAASCTVRLRKYILVHQPQLWRLEGGFGIVVESPMLELPQTGIIVPIKRSNGSTGFLARREFNEDSCSLYADISVSQLPIIKHAHGVAVFDSSDDEGFFYKRGDRFWISLITIPILSDSIVPVINLRTFKSGVLDINKACWFPKCSNDNGEELWTYECDPSAEADGRFSSWVVCQYTNGRPSHLVPREIPHRLQEDKTYLPTNQLTDHKSTILFRQRYLSMVGEKNSSPKLLSLPATLPSPDTIIVDTTLDRREGEGGRRKGKGRGREKGRGGGRGRGRERENGSGKGNWKWRGGWRLGGSWREDGKRKRVPTPIKLASSFQRLEPYLDDVGRQFLQDLDAGLVKDESRADDMLYSAPIGAPLSWSSLQLNESGWQLAMILDSELEEAATKLGDHVQQLMT